MIKRNKSFLYGFVAFNIFWFILDLCIHSDVLVGPIEVYSSFGKILRSHIGIHIGASFLRIFEGLFISLLIGVPFGLLLANSQKINRICSPLLYFTYPYVPRY